MSESISILQSEGLTILDYERQPIVVTPSDTAIQVTLNETVVIGQESFFQSGETLAARQVVYGYDNKAYLASMDDFRTAQKVVGIVKQVINVSSIRVVLSGVLSGFTGLTPNKPIYLGYAGNITQMPPTLGTELLLGFALNETTIFISISEPRFLR